MLPVPVPAVRTLRRAKPIQLGVIKSWSIIDADLPIAGLSSELAGLRVVHLSDTHFTDRWQPSYDRLLADIAELKADLIAFTGDWIEDKFDPRAGTPIAQRFARGLHAKLGVFSCLGNHDGDLIAPYLIDAGVRVLVGEMARVLGGESSIEVIGLPGVARDDLSEDLLDHFGQPAAAAVRIVLSHYPDFILRSGRLAAHLTLSGHTHGGQICLPGGRPLMTHDRLPWRQSGGLHQVSPGQWLHVSRGIGCSAYPLRAFSPPEITRLNLIDANAASS